jgi:hypothetical protein
VVGIFSTASDKVPSSLDTALFTWQQLLKISTKLVTLREIMKTPTAGHFPESDEFHSGTLNSFPSQLMPLPSITSRPSTATAGTPSVVDMGSTHSIKVPTLTEESLQWTEVSPESGIFTTKVSLGAGLDVQVRLIGRPPQREYLERTIPKKIRLWLGLKY